MSLAWWKADGPTGLARVPLFVVTHRDAGEAPPNSVYTFVTDGIEAAHGRRVRRPVTERSP